MNISRVIKIYQLIQDRLPSTYPRPKLVFYQDEQSMVAGNNLKEKDDETVYAVVNPETNIISLPLTIEFEHKKRNGEKIVKHQKLSRMQDDVIAHTLIHECGHLYAGERYGYDSKQYNDEKYCDRFAERWIKRLKRDGLL